MPYKQAVHWLRAAWAPLPRQRWASLPNCAALPVGAITVRHEAGLVQVDGWATFKAPARIAVLVRELRSQVGAVR